ncbi:MAG: type I 3-dehydroquinate dehydratase [Bacteroidales bacterium]|nr:type I 3-dehydroquinate dehydratase [Bacteroidales bacterium]
MNTLDQIEMAEIRLDLTGFGIDEIKMVFSHKTPLIATCRPDQKGQEDQLERLSAAIKAGAKYVDVEIEALSKQREKIIDIARQFSCKVIISYHNFEFTPGLKELYQIADKCFALGADIAKIAAYSGSNADNARLLSLYSMNKPVVILGMGETGKLTRIMAPLMGAEFTFAAADTGDATAPGQISYSKMKELIEKIEKELT